MELKPSVKNKLKLYLDELKKCSDSFNLCSFSKESLWQEVVENSLIFADAIIKRKKKQDVKICDVGSGAGIPGIILKIVLEEAEVDLIESNGKKAGFLENVSEMLKLKGLNILNRDAREIADKVKKRYNAVTGRAFGGRFLKCAEKLAAPGGIILYFKKEVSGSEFRKKPDEVLKYPDGFILLWNNV
ncbi:MAG: 16S rRNA (guanine(527)-N(7))-methyltransferase RsmG [Elusimicrobia bacterium CG08_land_8_20_14_0_20_44_26]|nr:MAG: 16S rRNA (guanine(527)-N(7))-methyltransferase RsmG [Elusimicrobia bacterium CG08_land_8_20_14_0_20_44_26]